MKFKALTAAILSMTIVNVNATEQNIAANELTTKTAKLSYSIGADLGKNFKTQNIELDPKVFMSGLNDGLNNNTLKMTEPQMKEALDNLKKDLIARRNAEFKTKQASNKAQGEAFLKNNKTKEGVKTTESGLQYKVIKKGSGAKPAKNDMVEVEYTGTTVDGKVFDSTKKSGKPAKFQVSRVIPGWTEALQMMPAGSVWEIYVPADLAYGPRNVGGPIGPNSALIFKVNLLSVLKNDKQNLPKN